jgi:hypothetical protein
MNNLHNQNNQQNMKLYKIQNETLRLGSQTASNEGSKGESIYFVSDFAIEGPENDPKNASIYLIELLTKKNQRLHLH